MNTKRILALFAAVLILISACGCGGSGKKSDTSADVSGTSAVSSDTGSASSGTDPDTSSETGTSSETTSVINDGEAVSTANFRIVYSVNCTAEEKNAAEKLYGLVKEQLGYEAELMTDDNERGDIMEIIIGNTNRPETITAKVLLTDNNGTDEDSIICFIDGNIVIRSGNYDSIVDVFFNEYLKTGSVTDTLCDIRLKQVTVDGITDFSGYNIVHPQYATSYLVKLESEKLIGVLRDNYNADVGFVADTKPADTKEIIISGSAREGIETFSDHEKYSIRVVGNTIFLEGGSDRSTAMAITELTYMLKNGMSVYDGMSRTGNYYSGIAGQDKDYFERVWGDDFDGTDYDHNRWALQDMAASDILQEMNSNTYYVRDGEITLFSSTIPQAEQAKYGGKKYRTPRFLVTKGKMEFQYGIFEIKSMIPFYYGNSAAYWFCSTTKTPKGYTFELDLVELLGKENNVVSNLHVWGTKHTSFDGVLSRNTRSHTFSSKPEDLRQEYHTYFMNWTPEYIDFGVDAEVYYRADITPKGISQFADKSIDTTALHLPIYVILSEFLYTPGRNLGWGLKGNEGDFVYTMKIDHVDIYQQSGVGKMIYF